MPRSATFSVTAAGAHSSAHNSREEKPKYLIGTLPGSENFYDLRYSDSDFLELAAAKYKETTGQKMQQKQKDALIKETVLSIEAHHTEADVQKVFDELAAKYGGHYVTELSIHRDEGHFEDENGITYYPTKDILKKEDGWYIVPLAESITHASDYRPKGEEFSEKVDINDFNPIHNVHAHVKFSMFNPDIGKTGRMKHNELNDRIKTAARVLKLKYEPEKKSDKRGNVTEVKSKHKAVRNEKVSNFIENGPNIRAKNRQIEQLEYNFREAQKRISSLQALDVEQKKELHRLNTEINKTADGEVKVQKIAELEKKLTDSTEIAIEAQNALLEAQNTIEAKKGVIERLKAQNVEKDKSVTDIAVQVGILPPETPTFPAGLVAPKIAEAVEQLTVKAKEETDQLVDMIAELHSAIDHQDPDLSKIAHRQRETLSYKRSTKEPYKTAVERRNEAYKGRLEQNRPKEDAAAVALHKTDVQEAMAKIERYNAQHLKTKAPTIKASF